ncbi:MAG: EamA family transporter [Clostridia bacterium]|nr:EamA family transporter [Clostridia bacterium]
MNSYLMIVVADFFLATSFVFQKKYQKTAGTTLKAGLTYNTWMGIFCAVMFFVMNNFRINLTAYSVMMSAFSTITGMLYVFIGFKILEMGNVAHYTFFLMSGGMVLPYIFGVLFLNEELTLLRTIGLVAIVAAIAISNTGEKKLGRKPLLLCIAVFVLNGLCSIVSKLHQISPASELITSSDYAFLVVVWKVVLCSISLLVIGKRCPGEKIVKLPMKTAIWVILFAAVSDGLSYVLQLAGASTVPASVLFPMVTGGSVILTSLAGTLVFQERLSGRQVLGIIICFAGTLLFL